VTNFGGMEPPEGYKTQTLLTLIMGVTAMAAIFILTMIFK
jgi:GntP family gluconate:H+ symporter